MCGAIAAGRVERIASNRAFESRISNCRRASGALCCKACSMRSASGVTGAGRAECFGFTRWSVAMQILITHGNSARTRALRINRWQLGVGLLGLMFVLTLLSGTVYHFVFLKAAREGWLVVSHLVRFVVRVELAQRDRFMRENLDVMAQRLSEVQAKLIKLEPMSERVSAAAGVKPDELKAIPKSGSVGGAAGQGGPFVPFASGKTLSLDQLNGVVTSSALQNSNQTEAAAGVDGDSANRSTTNRANAVSRDDDDLTLESALVVAISRRKKISLGPRRAIARSSHRML